MFALKPRIEIVIRLFLTAVMLVNALVPTVALAAPGRPTAQPQKVHRINKVFLQNEGGDHLPHFVFASIFL
jgi:hypothetical protein